MTLGSASNRVTVLSGGFSEEREISLRTGAAVEEALRDEGFEVETMEMGTDAFSLDERLRSSSVVFNALHGGCGENGCVQGFLEILGVPYTHSGVLASALAMDKPAARRLFEASDILVADGVEISHAEITKADPMARPFVFKPRAGGSSVGVSIIGVDDPVPVPASGQEDELVLVEAYVPGREITVAVIGGESLTPLEIRPTTGFYDYRSKYEPGASEYLVPAPVSEALLEKVREVAARAHAVLGCRGVSRADFRLDDSSEPARLVLLEVNTQPGLTRTSLVPRMARHAGIQFGDLCAWMVEDASCQR